MCVGGPVDGDIESSVGQDASGNLVVEGLNAGYLPWAGAIDGDAVTFSGPRDKLADTGGCTTDASYALEATSRFRMNGVESWSWTDGSTSCAAEAEVSIRKR